MHCYAETLAVLNTVKIDIDSFYTAIINALKLSAKHCIPSSVASTKCYIVPGWNEYVKEHHTC